MKANNKEPSLIPKKRIQSKNQQRRPSFSNGVTTATLIQPINSVTQPLAHAVKNLPIHKKIAQFYPRINHKLIEGINDNLLVSRKQNYLNTYHNIRRNKQKDIAKENKNNQNRINSQKSLYSSIDLNKSFESNCQIKKRLSQSKLSQRSRLNSSISTPRNQSKNQKRNQLDTQKRRKFQIQTSNIQTANARDLKGFKGLFFPSSQSKRNLQRQSKDNKQYSSYQSYRKRQFTLRPIRNSQGIMSLDEQKRLTGGLLHRIAQQIKQGKQKNNAKQSKAPSRNNYKNIMMFN